jgi:hypothetical protein
MHSGIGWVSELIEIAGGEDVFPELRKQKAAKDRIVSPHDVIAAAPDVIVASWCGKKVVLDKIRLVRRMSHRVDPAAIAEEELEPCGWMPFSGLPDSLVPVGDSSTPESRTLTPLIMVRIGLKSLRICSFLARRNSLRTSGR